MAKSLEPSESDRKSLDEIEKAFDISRRGEVRRALLRGDLVMGPTPEIQAKIDQLRARFSERRRAEAEGKPFSPPALTAENQYVPRADEELLIRQLLGRMPPEHRNGIRALLLRTDGRFERIPNDPEADRILKQIYALREKRGLEQ
jgi:hypothetical protein